MAVNQSNDNVHELLQQLEELKQKKAQNVKKLKRKLGRAVLLRKDSNTEYVPVNFDNKSVGSKPVTSEMRPVLSELNNSLPSENFLKQSSENEIMPKGNCRKNLNNNSDCFVDLQASQSKDIADSQVNRLPLLQNDCESHTKEVESHKLDLSIATSTESSNDAAAKNNLCNQNFFKKRAAVEFVNKEHYNNHPLSNKKIKMTDALEKSSQFQICCLNTYNNTYNNLNNMVDESNEYYPLLPSAAISSLHQIPEHGINNYQNTENVCAENDTICIVPSSQLEVNSVSLCAQTSLLSEDLESKKLEKIEESQKTFSVTYKRDESKVASKNTEVSTQLYVDQGKTREQKCVTIIHDNQLKNFIEDKQYPKAVEETEKIKIALEVRNAHNSSVNQILNPHESPEYHFEDDLDYTTTEIAETVNVFLSKSTPEAMSIDSSSLLKTSQPEVASYEEVGEMSFFEMEDTEDMMRNLQPVTNDSEEHSIRLEKYTEDLNNSKCEDVDFECDNNVFEDNCKEDLFIKNSPEDTSNSIEKNERADLEIFCNKESTNIIQEGKPSLYAIDSDVLVVPETELFDFSQCSTSEMQVDNAAQNITIVTDNDKCKNLDQDCQTAEKDANSHINVDSTVLNNIENKQEEKFNSQSEQQNISKILETYSNNIGKISYSQLDTPPGGKCLSGITHQHLLPDTQCSRTDSEENGSNLEFVCSLQCGILESVCNMKVIFFNNCQYLFIQHLTWIQVWRLERNSKGWVKIYCHQVDNSFQLKELCVSSDENCLVLVLLLISEQYSLSLQFILFEKGSKTIKLMEHPYQFESRSSVENEMALICGLDNMRFACAQGQKIFRVYSHTVNCHHGSPRLLSVLLGVTVDNLHSICCVDKLPNALLGMSHNMLYIWHVTETRLVTSVPLQIDTFIIESCIWATIENGLAFLLVSSNGVEACQLAVTNLATGCFQIIISYKQQPALKEKISNSNICLAFTEPLLGAVSGDSAFIWSVDEEYCCASLEKSNASSIALTPVKDSFMIFIGCEGGCVNCYELNCR